MAFWEGARHWSKPYPRKFPGVTTFEVAALPAGTAVVTPTRVARIADAMAMRATRRGRRNIRTPVRMAASPWWGARPGGRIHGDGTP